MGKYWRLLGFYDAEDKTYAACVGDAQTSPYTPDETAILVGLRAIVGRGTAASLINHVQFRLTCTTFKPNTVHCGAMGGGLSTAPALQSAPLDWPVNQPVHAGVPITVEARNLTEDTPVKVEAYLYGQFES